LATRAPAAAATIAAAVEILNVFAPSPPVPQVSTMLRAELRRLQRRAWRAAASRSQIPRFLHFDWPPVERLQ